MKLQKTISVILAGLLLVMLGSCADSAAAEGPVSFLDAGINEENSNTVTYAGRPGTNEDLIGLVRQRAGIEIELVTPPQSPGSDTDNVLIMLQSGDELGMVYGTTSRLKTYYNAGVLMPLDELAAEYGYDMESIYGDNLPVMEDGKTYGLPAFIDIWLTLYNKEVFDDAGVAYPPLKGFTWEAYIETANQLTDSGQNIWGSYMLDYDCYNYMLATQKGAQPYKEDGSANFDDPRYLEALAFYYGLGSDEKIQPDALQIASGAYPWQQFIENGNMGMWVIGGWATTMLDNRENYPRDWKAGLAPMPYPEGETPSSLGIVGCYGIPITCKNPRTAFEAIVSLAENQYLLGNGRIPARIDLSDDEITSFIENVLVPTYGFDDIPAEVFRACWFDPDRDILPEKIIGTADSQINEIWIEEGQLYGMGQKSAEEALASIQERANGAIDDEQFLASGTS